MSDRGDFEEGAIIAQKMLRDWLYSLDNADLLEYCYKLLNEFYFKVKSDYDNAFVDITYKYRCDCDCGLSCENCIIMSHKQRNFLINNICFRKF